MKNNITLKQGEKAGIVGIIINLLLFAAKLTAGLLSGAVSVIADSINNLSDSGSAIIALISFKVAQKPADREHPFGHARIEYVMSMIVAFIIFSTGVSLFRESLQKVFNSAAIDFTPVLIPVLAISISAKLFLYFYYSRLSKKLSSSVLKASAADCIIDVTSSSIIMISMLIYRFVSFNLDAYLGLLVSVLVGISAIKIMIECKNSILGTAPDPELINRISDIVGSSDSILEVHDIIVHNYGGGKTLASLHVGIDGSKSAFEVHDIIDAIEHRLKDELDVDCTIHPDPMDPKDKTSKELFDRVLSTITEIDPRLTIHDFRIITDSTPNILDFDILQPFELEIDIADEINSRLSAYFPEYNLHITIDKG